MAVTGSQLVSVAGTANIAGTNLLPDIQRKLIRYDNKSFPIMTVMSRLNRIMPVAQPMFQWQEVQDDEPSITTGSQISDAGGGAPAGSSTATLNTLANMWGESFLEPVSNQMFECNSTPTYNTGAGTSACTLLLVPAGTISTIASGAMLIRLGNSFGEGNPYPESIVKQPVRITNTITQIAASVAITKLMQAFDTYYGPQFERDKQRTITQYKCDMERRAVFGKQFEELRAQTHGGISNTSYVRGTRGLLQSIVTNRITYSGTLTEATLDAAMLTIFGQVYGGSDMKLAFCGPNFLSDISSFVKAKVRKLDSVPQYGLSISEYIAPFGNRSLYLIEEKQFFQNPAYVNAAMILDPGNFLLRVAGPALMQVRGTSPTGESRDSIAMESWFGVQTEMEISHALISH